MTPRDRARSIELFVGFVIVLPALFIAAIGGALDDAALRSPLVEAAPVPAEREFIATGPFVQAERGERMQLTTTLPPPVLPEPSDDPWLRTDFPHGASGTVVEGRCTQYEGLLARFQAEAGWNVLHMSKIMWRESRCTPGVVSNIGCCVSLLQLYVNLHLRDHRLAPRYNACGVYAWRDVDGPEDVVRHVCAAAALYDVVGTDAWAATR